MANSSDVFGFLIYDTRDVNQAPGRCTPHNAAILGSLCQPFSAASHLPNCSVRGLIALEKCAVPLHVLDLHSRGAPIPITSRRGILSELVFIHIPRELSNQTARDTAYSQILPLLHNIFL